MVLVSLDGVVVEYVLTGLVLEIPVTGGDELVRVELEEPVPEELEPPLDAVLLLMEVELIQVNEVCVTLELELPILVVVVVTVDVVPTPPELVEVVLTPLVVELMPWEDDETKELMEGTGPVAEV